MTRPLFQAHDLRAPGLGPFSLALEKSQITCLHGPSGTGKSRLLRLLADLDEHEGAMVLDSQSYTAFSGPQWRSAVTLFSPRFSWWQDRVGDCFVEVPSAQDLLALSLPADILVQSSHQMSSGETQRLGLLCALGHHPKVLLLDEPTAHLDPDTTVAVEALVKQYVEKHDAACLWVSHDPLQRERIAAVNLVLGQSGLRVC